MNDNKCAICGNSEKDDGPAYDLIREVYFFQNNQTFEAGLFQPRLNFVELNKLVAGFNHVCNNRTRCRNRARKKYMTDKEEKK